MIPIDSEELGAFSNDIVTKFYPCVLKDQHQNVRVYQVQNTDMPWDELFQNMEDLKTQYENIVEEYSVNETTLEEIFIALARNQYPDRLGQLKPSGKGNCCQC